MNLSPLLLSPASLPAPEDNSSHLFIKFNERYWKNSIPSFFYSQIKHNKYSLELPRKLHFFLRGKRGAGTLALSLYEQNHAFQCMFSVLVTGSHSCECGLASSDWHCEKSNYQVAAGLSRTEEWDNWQPKVAFVIFQCEAGYDRCYVYFGKLYRK